MAQILTYYIVKYIIMCRITCLFGTLLKILANSFLTSQFKVAYYQSCKLLADRYTYWA